MNTSTTNTAHPRRVRGGFTLIELLTVIAIIGILAAILIPVVAKVRHSARITQGLGNLREIGRAVFLYATENKDNLPLSYRMKNPSTDYSVTLSGLLDRKGVVYAERKGPRHSIFSDPLLPDHAGKLHFSAHPRLMPSSTTNVDSDPDPTPTKLSSVLNPSQVLMVADGSPGPTGAAEATLSKPNNLGWLTKRRNFAGDLDAPVAVSATVPDGATGYLRWTDGKFTKVLFADGHVARVPIAGLYYRNLVLE